MSKLTPKQQRFIDEYLIDLNATQAAIRAGYSAKTAQEQSSRLLSNVMVQEAIKAGQAKLAKRTLVTQDMVVKGLLDEAKDTTEGSSHSARVSAWAHLGKHLGMFKDKVEHTGRNGGPIQTENAHVPLDDYIAAREQLKDEY